MESKLNLTFWILILFGISQIVSDMSLINITQWRRPEHKKPRKSRGLIFEGGGVAKILLGAIFPIHLEDKVKWRQLNCGYNFQAQYDVPTDPTYWWEKWEGRTLRQMKEEFEQNGSHVPDESRQFIYVAMETYMKQQGKNGRKCLCRSICENAQMHHGIGMFAEILHAVLTPGKDYVDPDYRDAYEAGRAGADCLLTYHQCPRGEGLLDSVVVAISNFDGF